MLYYGCQDSGLIMLEVKNAVVMLFIFLKHNGLRRRLADSNYFYTEYSILCTNFRVRVRLFAQL